MTAARLPHTVNRPLIARLEREWRAINRRPAVLRRAAGWGLGIEVRSLDDVVVATGYWPTRDARLACGARASAAAEEVLRRLLLAARGDDVAGRVVLQRLLPGLVSRSRRWGAHRAGGSVDAFDELLSAAWMVIREHSVAAHPAPLAPRLLNAAEYRAFGKANRRRLVHELVEPNRLDLPVEPIEPVDPAGELADVIACARTLSVHDLQLIELLAQGRTPAEVATVLEISERTVRYHRDIVVHRLRSAAVLAA